MKQAAKLFLLAMICLFVCSCNNNKEKKETTVSQQQDSLTLMDTINHTTNKNLTYAQAYDKALTLWKTPLEEKNVKTSFGNAHVIITGKKNAPALVLLHGMNASSTMWYPNIKTLSEQYRVYAIDFLLEPGKSQCCVEISSTDEIVNWYYQIFDQLQLKKYSLVGASRGGWLALNIALKSKSQINKIVLLSPAQTFKWIKPGTKIISNITYSINPKRKKLRNILATMTYDVDKLEQVYINQYYIATKEATVNKSFIEMTPFSDEQLNSLNLPILLLIGDKDIINNEKSILKAEKLLPNVEAEVITNAGHFLSFDQPEIVNKKMLYFLNNEKNITAKKNK